MRCQRCETHRFCFFRGGSLSFELPARAFSFSSSILFAVPGLPGHASTSAPTNRAQINDTHLRLNSSGTSTDGLPSAFSFASRRGFSSCCVREGRETYGRVLLHWYVKCPAGPRQRSFCAGRMGAADAPVPRHLWHTVDDVATALLLPLFFQGAYFDIVYALC